MGGGFGGLVSKAMLHSQKITPPTDESEREFEREMKTGTGKTLRKSVRGQMLEPVTARAARRRGKVKSGRRRNAEIISRQGGRGDESVEMKV